MLKPVDACWGLQVAAPALVGGNLKAAGKKPCLYLHLSRLVQLLGGSSVTLCFPEGSRRLWKKILHGSAEGNHAEGQGPWLEGILYFLQHWARASRVEEAEGLL